MSNANERQVGGNHYKDLGVEPWDAMRAWSSHEEFLGFLKNNAVKYLARAQSRRDIAKAHHYLEKWLEEAGETEGEQLSLFDEGDSTDPWRMPPFFMTSRENFEHAMEELDDEAENQRPETLGGMIDQLKKR